MAEMRGCGTAAFMAEVVAMKLRLTGCDFLSAGTFAAAAGPEGIVLRDPSRGI